LLLSPRATFRPAPLLSLAKKDLSAIYRKRSRCGESQNAAAAPSTVGDNGDDDWVMSGDVDYHSLIDCSCEV